MTPGMPSRPSHTVLVGEMQMTREHVESLARWVGDSPDEFTEEEKPRVRQVIKHLQARVDPRQGLAARMLPTYGVVITVVIAIATLGFMSGADVDPMGSQGQAAPLTMMLLAQVIAAAIGVMLCSGAVTRYGGALKAFGIVIFCLQLVLALIAGVLGSGVGGPIFWSLVTMVCTIIARSLGKKRVA